MVKKKGKTKDERNLYGGQYRLSQRFANVINRYSKFNKLYTHNMTAFFDMNHFDVAQMLAGENIHRSKLIQITKEANQGNPKRWNTEREKLLIDGVVKLGKKYNVPLEKPTGINPMGNIRIWVKQKFSRKSIDESWKKYNYGHTKI